MKVYTSQLRPSWARQRTLASTTLPEAESISPSKVYPWELTMSGFLVFYLYVVGFNSKPLTISVHSTPKYGKSNLFAGGVKIVHFGSLENLCLRRQSEPS
jgi:hypothetical protein